MNAIAWATPEDPEDTEHPCYGIHNAYLSTPVNLVDDFLHELFQDVVTTHFQSEFDAKYLSDSLNAALNPGSPFLQDKYVHRLCGNAWTTYRVINGLCMAAITKPDVPFQDIFGGAKRDEEKGPSLADPPQSATNYMRIRYIPCDPPSEPVCCVQRLEYCRNTTTWATDVQRIATVIGQASACSLSVVSPVFIGPGETSTGCRDYCLDYEPGTEGGGNGPNLSGPVDRERAIRAEEVGYDGPGTANK